MNTEITLVIPETIYKRAEKLAQLTGNSVEQVLSRTLGRTLPPLVDEIDNTPIESLTNEQVIKLAESMMDTTLNARMSHLQYAQQARTITPDEHAELQMLMDVFNMGQLRKTQAMVEAVKRGLRVA